MTSPDPSVISNLEALGITEAELDAMVNVSLERMNVLAHFAAMHRDPGSLTPDEQTLFDGMRREIAANPGVAYHPMDLG